MTDVIKVFEAPGVGRDRVQVASGSGALMRADSTDTQTNKTLTSPILTTPTLSGIMKTSADHMLLNSGTTASDVAGKTIRLNSITNTGTANDFIGFQSKPGQGAATSKNIVGGEISPRINDTFALTGSGSIIGLHVDCYLKGTTGAIGGDVRCFQSELTDDTGSSRAVTGYITHLRVRSNLSCSATGKYSVIRVESEEGTKKLDCFAQFTTGTGSLVEANGTVGGTQAKAIKVNIDGTTFYVPLHTSVS